MEYNVTFLHLTQNQVMYNMEGRHSFTDVNV